MKNEEKQTWETPMNIDLTVETGTSNNYHTGSSDNYSSWSSSSPSS